MSPTRPHQLSAQLIEAGLFALVVALPLVFAPFAAAPFSDPKLVVLIVGCLLLSLARPELDRRIATFSIVWLMAVVFAAGFGVDPWWSFLGAENRGTGVLALGGCALALCAGTGVSIELATKLPTWLFSTAIVVSAVAVTTRFVQIGGSTWSLGSDGSSTIGHRVFAGGFVAAAVVAATSVRRHTLAFLGLLVVGSGLAVTATRSAWVGAALGLLLVVVLDRSKWRSVLFAFVPILVSLVTWTLIDQVMREKKIELSAAPRFAQLDEGSAQERLPALRANVRAWRADPTLGSGPGTGWFGFMSQVSAEEMRRAGRGFSDAHNLFVEMGTTTGMIGAAALLALGLAVATRFRRIERSRRWAIAAAVALGVVQMVQPFNLVITPLLFLFVGLAIGPPANARLRVRPWLVVFTSVALVAASARLLASSMERYGELYASETAYTWSLRIDPRRLGSALALAKHRAFDHRTGDPTAAADARAIARRAVHQHPWNPQVRLIAANVEVLLGSEIRARRWVQEDLRIFPNDPNALSGAAVLALRAGDRAEASTLARRALSLDPDLAQARSVLNALEER